ncbi:ParB/RepB/Spo0J family partition protein [Castellaniella sp.]|uniref:ParB/RepB/Spo0J family partition protein n=1 Tax=Castellaniella sp. TaxID=1955812 RepID=UPI002AFF0004|nr:ParB/RepB/Spo0J family partition protein [Castellaniella sp.]
MSVFTKGIRKSKLSEFEAPRPGEQQIDIDTDLIDFLPQQRSKDNPGLTTEALEELGANIVALGQIQSAVVRPNPDAPGRYIMVAGERRCRAVALKGLKLKAIVRTLTELEHLRIQRAENIHREALTNAEIAQALRADKETLGTLEAVAAEWQKSTNWVSERLRYLTAVESDPVVQQAIEQGVSSDVTTLNELSRLAKQDPAIAEDIVSQAAADPGRNIRQEVRDQLKKKKPRDPAAPKPATAPSSPTMPAPQTVASTRIDHTAQTDLAKVLISDTVEVIRHQSMWQLAGHEAIEFSTLDGLVAAVWGANPAIKVVVQASPAKQ